MMVAVMGKACRVLAAAHGESYVPASHISRRPTSSDDGA